VRAGERAFWCGAGAHAGGRPPRLSVNVCQVVTAIQRRAGGIWRLHLFQMREKTHAVVSDGVERSDVRADGVGGAKAGDGDDNRVGFVRRHIDGEAHDLIERKRVNHGRVLAVGVTRL
jgi:hypothetical protein